jgi:2-polyprenyl-3-methyl-5-hydroxy-6-metoxy-1,4-benzoquinol methylase
VVHPDSVVSRGQTERGPRSDLLCCPHCGSDLASCYNGSLLQCITCHEFFPVIDSIPSFTDRSSYWGEEFNLAEMREINSVAEQEGWRTAIDCLVAPKSLARAKYIREFFRSDWRFLFPVESHSRILDAGAGWGALSSALAEICGEVVALESAFERTRFIKIRADQDGIGNITPIHGTLAHPPLKSRTFDFVAMNGVLEWLGWADLRLGTRAVQLELLCKARSLLKPGGWLFVGIENRFSISYWLGALDHSYLKYTSLLPRPLAHLVTWLLCGHSYRTYTYSPWGYHRLLTQAGFRDVMFYGVLPNYSRPINYWPLGEGLPLKRLVQVLGQEKPHGVSRKVQLVQWMVTRTPSRLLGEVSRLLAPHLLIAARRGEE